MRLSDMFVPYVFDKEALLEAQYLLKPCGFSEAGASSRTLTGHELFDRAADVMDSGFWSLTYEGEAYTLEGPGHTGALVEGLLLARDQLRKSSGFENLGLQDLLEAHPHPLLTWDDWYLLDIRGASATLLVPRARGEGRPRLDELIRPKEEDPPELRRPDDRQTHVARAIGAYRQFFRQSDSGEFWAARTAVAAIEAKLDPQDPRTAYLIMSLPRQCADALSRSVAATSSAANTAEMHHVATIAQLATLVRQLGWLLVLVAGVLAAVVFM